MNSKLAILLTYTKLLVPELYTHAIIIHNRYCW